MMKSQHLFLLAAVSIAAMGAPSAQPFNCPPDSVRSGNICVDTYEASVWEIPPASTTLIKKVKLGIANLADLQAGGAVQRGVDSSVGFGPGCPDTGAGCKNLYAVSIPGVFPSGAAINWFQAAAVCRNSAKRLLTNAEWQVAALGTPDPGTDNGTTDCNIGDGTLNNSVALTGSRSACISDVGAHDMVGNDSEFVADWGSITVQGGTWASWSPAFGGDLSLVGGGGQSLSTLGFLPAATLRGGFWGQGSFAGVYFIDQNGVPASQGGGFNAVSPRCGR